LEDLTFQNSVNKQVPIWYQQEHIKIVCISKLFDFDQTAQVLVSCFGPILQS